MKLGIISDTHNNTEGIARAWDLFLQNRVEAVIHCGDWTTPATLTYVTNLALHTQVLLWGVLGNNDEKLIPLFNTHKYLVLSLSPTRVLELKLDNSDIAVYHGDNRSILQHLITSHKYDVVCTGHTHRPVVKTVDHTLLVNPGSAGFTHPGRSHKKLSVALYDTFSRQTDILYLSDSYAYL